MPFGINGVDDALGVNKEVFPVQSRRLEKDPPNEDDIRISAKLCELKPLNQNIKATPDDEPWNEDNDDFDASITELEMRPFAQTIDGILRDLLEFLDSWIGCRRCNGRQHTKNATIKMKRELVVLATSKK
jgi:hypothetical protein